jgi:hypothetical protein
LSHIVLGVFTDPLHSNGRHVAPDGSRGNVFTEPLPSDRSIRHNMSEILPEMKVLIDNSCIYASSIGKVTNLEGGTR